METKDLAQALGFVCVSGWGHVFEMGKSRAEVKNDLRGTASLRWREENP